MGNGESTQPRAASGEEDLSHKETAKTASAVAGAMLLGWGLYKIFTGSDEKSERKKMKAPGKDSVIYRDDFEKDPAGYFRSLRK